MKNFINSVATLKGSSATSMVAISEIKNLKKVFASHNIFGAVYALKEYKNLQMGWSFERVTNAHLNNMGADADFQAQTPKGKLWLSYPYLLQSINGEKKYLRFDMQDNTIVNTIGYYINGVKADEKQSAIIAQIIADKKAQEKAKEQAKWAMMSAEEQALKSAKARVFDKNVDEILKLKTFGRVVEQQVAAVAL